MAESVEGYQQILADLDLTLSLIGEPRTKGIVGPCIESRLFALSLSAVLTAQPSRTLEGATRAARYAQNDFFNLLTMFRRLDWMKSMHDSGGLGPYEFASFATADIDLFHVQARSIFDYLALCLVEASGRSKQLPTSFRELRDQLPKYASRLGPGYAEVIASCTWFHHLRDARDALIHTGAESLGFPHADRILFQIHHGMQNKIDFPPVMFNPHVVDFQHYAGLWFGRLFAFAHRVGDAIMTREGVSGSNPYSNSPGIPIALDWMIGARARVVECQLALP
jgi:hypothetical protein